MSDTSEALNITIDQSLLVEAKWMLREGHRAVAVLTAMRACEVVIARAVRQKLTHLKLEGLYDCLREVVGGFDLRHSSSMRLYETLTGHSIQQEATEVGMWSRYLDALHHQDKIVFEGAEIESEDADRVLDVATRFVALVTQANGL